MEGLEIALETKLQQLKLEVGRTDAILKLMSEEAMERHLSAIKALTTEADQCKRAVESKIAAKVDLEELNLWMTVVDTKIYAVDESVKKLRTTLEECRQEIELKKQEKELNFEKKLFEAKLKFQIELQLAKEQTEEAQLPSKTVSDGIALK